MDGAATEGARVDESLDEDGSCCDNRLLTRLRSDGAFREVVSLGGGESSEGSVPPSSYDRRNK